MKWCDEIEDSAGGIRDELSKVLKRLRSDVKSLNENLKSLAQ